MKPNNKMTIHRIAREGVGMNKIKINYTPIDTMNAIQN